MRTGQTVVITGASAGIGRAAAVEFARQGARVALLARGMPGLRAAQREVEAVGGQALVLALDVSDSVQVEEAADKVERVFGPIDVWVNNAMATLYAPLDDISPADFRRATEVSYLGTVWGTMAALKRMKPRHRGTIVQVGSALSWRSIPLQAPYCGAKAAVRGFTDALRSELIRERSGVHLTMVQLAAFDTPQFDWGRTTLGCQPRPLGPVFQPEVAARAIVRASRERRREWWVGWPALKAVLGRKLLSGYLDRRLAHRAWEGQQQAGEPLPRQRPDKLWAPVKADYGAHGRFDAQARDPSGQGWRSARRTPVLAAGTVLAALALVSWWSGRPR